MATDPHDIQLTPQQRELLAQRAAESGRDPSELLEEFFETLKASAKPKQARRTLFEVLDQRGLIGAMQGPGDLSSNPKHMEGFGESRNGSDST